MSALRSRLFYETWFGDFIKATSFCNSSEFSEDIHHEIEIIIKIKVGNIEPKFAHKYYEEISVGIFTARDLQTKLKAKSHLGKSQSIWWFGQWRFYKKAI
jgi:hypothetical protein